MIEAVEGDLTVQDVDVVVNAANRTLLGGGGVDGALHLAAGPGLLAECRQLRRTSLPDGLSVGAAVATGAGDLTARWVVHTVGPNRHRGQDDPAVLASCFRESLRVAGGLGARSVAFPAIGAGAFGWDVREAAEIAVGAVRDTLAVGDLPSVTLVRFVLRGGRALAAFRDELGCSGASPSRPS